MDRVRFEGKSIWRLLFLSLLVLVVLLSPSACGGSEIRRYGLEPSDISPPPATTPTAPTPTPPASTSISTATSTTTIRGTWLFDFDEGRFPKLEEGTADIWWEQVDDTKRYLVPDNGACLSILRGANFSQLTVDDLRGAKYSEVPINGSNDSTNQLTEGTVLGVITNKGRYVKVQIITYGYDLTICWFIW